MKEYIITLTSDEIEILKSALNYRDVKYYHRKIEIAKVDDDDISLNFWKKEWYNSLNLFAKLVKITKG